MRPGLDVEARSVSHETAYHVQGNIMSIRLACSLALLTATVPAIAAGEEISPEECLVVVASGPDLFPLMTEPAVLAADGHYWIFGTKTGGLVATVMSLAQDGADQQVANMRSAGVVPWTASCIGGEEIGALMATGANEESRRPPPALGVSAKTRQPPTFVLKSTQTAPPRVAPERAPFTAERDPASVPLSFPENIADVGINRDSDASVLGIGWNMQPSEMVASLTNRGLVCMPASDALADCTTASGGRVTLRSEVMIFDCGAIGACGAAFDVFRDRIAASLPLRGWSDDNPATLWLRRNYAVGSCSESWGRDHVCVASGSFAPSQAEVEIGENTLLVFRKSFFDGSQIKLE